MKKIIFLVIFLLLNLANSQPSFPLPKKGEFAPRILERDHGNIKKIKFRRDGSIKKITYYK